MSSQRIVSAVAALLLSIPALSAAQTPGQPQYGADGDSENQAGSGSAAEAPADDASDEDTSDEDSEDDGEEDDTPMGEPETVEPPADPAAKKAAAPPAPDAAAPPAKVEVVKTVEKTVNISSGSRPRVGSKWNRGQAEKEGRNHLWFLDIGGYIRAGYTGIQNDPDGRFGLYDGFALGNARLSLNGEMKSLGFKLQIDGAVDRNDDANDPNSEVVTRLKDANIYWQPVKPVRLTVGQFKPPFDVEEQFSTTEILFVDRSVGSRGVKNIEGRNVRGLSTAREVGVQLGTDHWHFGAEDDEKEGFGVSYALALTNGHDANTALNDNDKLAFYGRGELHWADMVTVGGAYFLNDRTIGIEPDTIEEQRSGWTADLTFTAFDITLVGSVIGESVARPSLSGVEPETSGLAYQGQLAYKAIFGIQPAVRYAYFDPTESSTSSDALTYITFGLNWVPDYPVSLLLNYTIAGETEEFSLPNNRFDGVLQVTW